MLAWNSPYVLAVIIGLISVGIYHFDQKHKKNEIEKMSYLKIFILVAGSITGFYYFLYPTLSSNPLATQTATNTNPITTSMTSTIETPIPTIAQSAPVVQTGSGSSLNATNNFRTSPVSAFTPYKSDGISILGTNLKIREGPVPF